MSPKDFVDVISNYFYSIQMDNEREEADEIDLTIIQRTSSIDSLEQNESNIQNLRFISGCHKWINTNNNNNIRVEKSYMINNDTDDSIHDKTFLIMNKNKNDIEDDANTCNTNQMDVSLNHFDVQLQVNNGQHEQATRYGVFSSLLSKDLNLIKIDQYSQTIEPEMDMDDRNGNNNNNYYSKQYNGNNSTNNNNNNDDGSYRRNHQTNGSSGNGGNGNADGNGSNPNRNNNNNPRRPNGNGNGNGDNEDDEENNETDESLARRLGFRPIDNDIIRLIGRIRRLTNKQSFDHQDFENVQYLIDELIRLQHLENSSQEHLEQIIHYLKLYRILRSKSHALQFIQDRLPRCTNRSNNDNNSNVFDIWRERERRARLDSKDSLEDEGQNTNGQQSHDKVEFNYSTSPIIHSNNFNSKSKVKQMARHIDTRSGSSRTGDYVRHSSPSPINQNLASDRLYSETFTDDRSRTRRQVSPISSSEQRRVRQMVDRLESSSASSAHPKVAKTISANKSYYEEHSNTPTNFTSSPNYRRTTRRENEECSFTDGNRGSVRFRDTSPYEEVHVRDNNSNMRRFEYGYNEALNSGRHTTSGTHMNEYVNSTIPDAETSVSMVRDFRTRFYDDDLILSRTQNDNIPVKVDVETLYILEQKSVPPNTNIYTPDYGYNRSSTLDRHDFAAQTTIPTINQRPSNRPIGTQVNTTVEQNTVSAQTTDSLHRPIRERQCITTIASVEDDEDSEIIRKKTTTTTTKYEVKRRHSSHHSSDDEDDAGTTTIVYTDDKENYQAITQPPPPPPPPPMEEERHDLSEQRTSYVEVTSHERTDETSDTNRNLVRRHIEQSDYSEDEYHSSEVYEIHTRGACKCLVVSYEEKPQYGAETRFEKQLQRIERTYTEEELRSTELHVIVTASDENYQLVRREYTSNRYDGEERIYDKTRYPSITIHYYTKDGIRTRTEQRRSLENLPLFIRCEIEYELNHYGM
ncbi:unnamed protein product [Rotaria sp. Silwood1]|nr:unnamed protein product [Rotaria sp. Silwood1]CAF4682218.1 unnamed protein product [Rotaria sp. Silwood1]CAF4775900.1 unnamed protein product [Rotaria sp. Silwood1]